MDDDTKAAWAVVEEAAKDSPLYNGTVHSALNDLRSRLARLSPQGEVIARGWVDADEAQEFVHYGDDMLTVYDGKPPEQGSGLPVALHRIEGEDGP